MTGISVILENGIKECPDYNTPDADEQDFIEPGDFCEKENKYSS